MIQERDELKDIQKTNMNYLRHEFVEKNIMELEHEFQQLKLIM